MIQWDHVTFLVMQYQKNRKNKQPKKGNHKNQNLLLSDLFLLTTFSWLGKIFHQNLNRVSNNLQSYVHQSSKVSIATQSGCVVIK